MIEDISKLADRTKNTFTRVTEHAKKAGDLISRVGLSSQKQEQRIEENNRAISEINIIIRQNAMIAEEFALTSKDLNIKAKQINNFINDLAVLVYGSQRF
jgi:methyl-accepting chemotaxis protein